MAASIDKTPLVSVIMGTHNCSSTIRSAIDSVVNQSFNDWEFIICDDCSTDETPSVLSYYKNRFPNKFIILRNDSNCKLAYSLNRCLSVSRGKYIARMDGDDMSDPSRLQKQVDYLETHPEVAVVGTFMSQFDENGIFGQISMPEYPDPSSLLMSTPFCHATILMRKKAYDDIGGYTVAKRTIRGQDIDLWFKFYSKGFTGYNIQETLYLVREDRNAVRRRKLKYRFYESLTRLKGYKLLGFPKSKYVYALAPVLSFFVPVSIKRKLRKSRN